MKISNLTLALLAAFILTSCSATPPLTPEQLMAQEVETNKALDYFSREIVITDSGRANTPITSLKLAESGNGYVVKYYSNTKIEPLFEEQVVSCIGSKNIGPELNCKLFNGVNRRASIKITQVPENTIVKDPRLIPIQKTISVPKGALLVTTQHSPMMYQYAAEFRKE